jgi:hypothetical protein
MLVSGIIFSINRAFLPLLHIIVAGPPYNMRMVVRIDCPARGTVKAVLHCSIGDAYHPF